jgi:hypothetical protein
MKKFLTVYGDQVLGVLSGFDRIRFRGTFRQLAYTDGMMSVLSHLSVLLKNFRTFVDHATQHFKAGIEDCAKRSDRPIEYLASPATNKEQLVQKLFQERGPSRNGVVAIFSTIEGCRSYEIRRDRESKKLKLQSALRKCLHYYVYLQDPMFGLVHVRMQSWLPFNTNIVINGREWLARQMDARHLKYQRADNCFPWIEDFDLAQQLANKQVTVNWPNHLHRLLYRVNPALREIWPTVSLEPYWSAEQSEWATDVAFRSTENLAALHSRFLQHAITNFKTSEVMRFLGSKACLKGQINSNFKKQVISEIARRQEGVRIKHRLGDNSIKMYDKQGSVLRVETTINKADDLKVFRPKEGDKQGKREYRSLRKGVSDLRRRTQLCQSANKRYLDSLSATDSSIPLKTFTDRLSQPIIDEKRRTRALNPLGKDAELLTAIRSPEYFIKGFRNADIRTALLGADPDDAKERRRRSARISRLIAILRAHGLVKKIPHTRRYQITAFAQQCLPAIVAAREASVQKLIAA